MKKLMKLAAAVTLSAVVLGSFTTPVAAQTTVEQNQELNQTVRVNCTTSGSYGQDTTCTAEGTQTGKQNQIVTIEGVTYVVRPNGSRVRYHKPVNTSVSALTLSGIIATALTTAGAGFVISKKK